MMIIPKGVLFLMIISCYYGGMVHHPHRRTKKSNHARIDRFVSIVAVISPFMMIPQIHVIFTNQDATGVSVISWIASVVISIMWLVYGLAHKEKPIVMNSFLGCLLSFFIVVGAMMYQ